MISRVEALYARLDKIREDSSEMSADEKRSYYARLNEINDKQTGLTAQLDALKSASVGSYDELKRDIEERILEIEQLLIQMRQL